MNVAELIEWLKTQDQGAKVQVLVRVPTRGYEGDSVDVADFVPALSDYTDFRDNRFVAADVPHKGCRFLLLGEN